MLERTGNNTYFGHFIAYVKNSRGWLRISDSFASQTEPQDTNEVVIFVLQRKTTNAEEVPIVPSVPTFLPDITETMEVESSNATLPAQVKNNSLMKVIFSSMESEHWKL